MSALTIADFDNAKTDLDFIAEMATTADPTAVDRLGTTKRTLRGAIDSVAAINFRGAWATANAPSSACSS